MQPPEKLDGYFNLHQYKQKTTTFRLGSISNMDKTRTLTHQHSKEAPHYDDH